MPHPNVILIANVTFVSELAVARRIAARTMNAPAGILLLGALAALTVAQDIPSPIICLDTLDGTDSRFRHNDVPCLLRCNDPVAQPTGDLLPGMVNTTAIPFCQLDCVHHSATPEQSSAAPACNEGCRSMSGSPENVGWCMFWCVEGYADIVHSTTCVPSLVYGDPTVSAMAPDVTVTVRPFTQPPEFVRWLETQTVMSAGLGIGAPMSSISPGGDESSETTTTTSSVITSAATLTEGGVTSSDEATSSGTSANSATSSESTTARPGDAQGASGQDSDDEDADDDDNDAVPSGALSFLVLLASLGMAVGFSL